MKRLINQNFAIRFLSLITVAILLCLCSQGCATDKGNITDAHGIIKDIKICTGADLRVEMSNFGSDISQYKKVVTDSIIDSYLIENGTKLDDVVLDPVTTDNGLTFTMQDGSSAEANSNYLEFESYFIASRDMWVHLSTEAYDADGFKFSGTKVTTDSQSSTSDIAHAVRIAFKTATDLSVYEPNKGTPSTELSTFGLPMGTMTYNNSNRLFHLDKLTPVKVTICVWLESEDPQCDKIGEDNELSIQLNLVGCDENGNPIA